MNHPIITYFVNYRIVRHWALFSIKHSRDRFTPPFHLIGNDRSASWIDVLSFRVSESMPKSFQDFRESHPFIIEDSSIIKRSTNTKVFLVAAFMRRLCSDYTNWSLQVLSRLFFLVFVASFSFTFTPLVVSDFPLPLLTTLLIRYRLLLPLLIRFYRQPRLYFAP